MRRRAGRDRRAEAERRRRRHGANEARPQAKKGTGASMALRLIMADVFFYL